MFIDAGAATITQQVFPRTPLTRVLIEGDVSVRENAR
jgi:hypothetical protein